MCIRRNTHSGEEWISVVFESCITSQQSTGYLKMSNKAGETKQQDPYVFCDCIWNNNQARFLPIKVYDAVFKCFYRQQVGEYSCTQSVIWPGQLAATTYKVGN